MQNNARQCASSGIVERLQGTYPFPFNPDAADADEQAERNDALFSLGIHLVCGLAHKTLHARADPHDAECQEIYISLRSRLAK